MPQRITLENINDACKRIGDLLFQSETTRGREADAALRQARRASCNLVRNLMTADFFEAYSDTVKELGVTNDQGGLKTLRDLFAENPSLEILTDPSKFHLFLDQERQLFEQLGYSDQAADFYINRLRTRFDDLGVNVVNDSAFDQDISASGFHGAVMAFSNIVCDDSQDPEESSDSMKVGLSGIAVTVADMMAAAPTSGIFLISTGFGAAIFSVGVGMVRAQAEAT